MHVNHSFVQNTIESSSFWGSTFPENAQFSVDTRTLQPGDVFVALSGQKVDGHDFIQQALEKKAAGIIASQKYKKHIEAQYAEYKNTVSFVFVQDPETSLLDLAKQWRSKFSIPVVGITGSVGKTTTKEIVSSILRYAGKPYLVSHGNQNTKIGAALNVLKLRQEHAYAVFEMGIGGTGDMDDLADLVRPTLAVITKIAPAHVSGLGAMEKIATEKRKIFSRFAPEHIGIINGDQEILTRISYPHPIVKFGKKMTNQIQVRKLVVKDNTISCVLKIYKEKFNLLLPGCNISYVENILPATAVAHFLGISGETIVKALSQPVTVPGRFEVQETKNNGLVINDCYNANPESMRAGLTAFHGYKTKREKVVVLGDMLELGLDSVFWHRQLGRLLTKLPSIGRVVLVGSMVDYTRKTLGEHISVDMVSTWQDAEKIVQPYISEKYIVFFKSSHGIGLFNILNRL